MDTQFYVLTLLIFVAVVFLLEGGYLFWNSYKGPEARRIEQRLRNMSAGAHHGSIEHSLLKVRLLSDTKFVHHLLLAIPRIHLFDRVLLQAGLEIKLGSFLGIVGFAGIAGFLLGKILGLLTPMAVLVGLFSLGVPVMYVLRRRQAVLVKFEEQLPEALDLMTRALRAGHALPNAIKMIGEEMPEPVGNQFHIVFDEVNYGFSMQEALMNLANRIPSADLRFFVLAVTIQRETGGNLAELLNNISKLIRGRLQLLGTIRVLSAEGVMSAWILCLLPFAVAIFINLINPGYLSILWTDEAGIKLLTSVLVMMCFGVLLIRKIIKVHV